MSETDDTDVLLLIPPNFFLVNSSGSEESLLDSSRTVVHKPTSCTAQVIGKLFDQVHTLETRLESLELSTTSDTFSSLGSRTRCNNNNWDSDSVDNHSSDRKCYTFPRRRRRKIANRKTKDLSLTSLDSASTNITIPRLKFKESTKPVLYQPRTDDLQNMDGDLSSIVSTPSKKNDKLLLNEIDEFLTKVEAYESPDSKFTEHEPSLSPENIIKAAGDYISKKFDSKDPEDEVKLPSGRIVSSAILDKYIYLVKNNPGALSQRDGVLSHQTQNKDTTTTTTTTSHLSDITSKSSQPYSKSSQETKSPGVRRLNFSDTKEVQPTSTPKKPLQSTSSYLDSFRPSSNKIYNRASQVLEQYKAQNYSRSNQNSAVDSFVSSPQREEFKMPQMRPYVPENKCSKLSEMQNKFLDSIDTDLLSLSDLWGEKANKFEKGESLKLEEERLKREHCEAMIQQLQKKLLEQQEKIAVAIKVDRAKDTAISKLREAWLKVTSSLDKAEERHKSALEKMLREVDNFKMVADESQKKTNHFEAELYKALDLAHDYQDKCKQFVAEKKEYQNKLQQTLKEKDELINNKDKEIEVLKENYDTIMRLNKQSTDCIRNLEDTLGKEKIEHEETKSKVTELNRKIQSLNDENVLIQQERDVLKEKVNEERARFNIIERQLCEKQNQCSELCRKCDTLESDIKTLRKHLELQKNELKTHYQKQLEEAVLAKLQEFQQQLDHAEQEMEENTRSKENVIIDTYNKQITRIEEQHKLEVNVLEEKQKEEINLYRLQLAQASERIGLLENKLDSYRRRRGQIATQLHSVMESQWRQALQILTNGNTNASSLDLTRTDSVATPVAQDYGPPKIPPLTMPTFADKGLMRNEDRRSSNDKLLNLEGLTDSELQHYVKLLLTKSPNLDGSGDNHADKVAEEPTSDRPDNRERKDKAKKSLNTSKPPWKA